MAKVPAFCSDGTCLNIWMMQDKKKVMAEEPAFLLHGAFLVEVAKPTCHIAESLRHLR